MLTATFLRGLKIWLSCIEGKLSFVFYFLKKSRRNKKSGFARKYDAEVINTFTVMLDCMTYRKTNSRFSVVYHRNDNYCGLILSWFGNASQLLYCD